MASSNPTSPGSPHLVGNVLRRVLPLEASHGRYRANDEGRRDVGSTLGEIPRDISLLKVLGHRSDWPWGLSAQALADSKRDELTVRADDLIQALSFSYALVEFGDGQTSRTEVAVHGAL